MHILVKLRKHEAQIKGDQPGRTERRNKKRDRATVALAWNVALPPWLKKRLLTPYK